MTEHVVVVAVIVTWNRRDLLREALSAIQAQTRAPDRLVVVDNASTDGTQAVLSDEFPNAEVLRTTKNGGGAAGFALGIRHALDAGPCDLVWLMDDDTVPEPGALEALLAARTSYDAQSRAALLASRVVWTDGRDHPMNTPRRRGTADPTGCRRIRSASFVSVLVDARVIRERGLPIADYFLWNDDFEFTTRILRGNIGVLCPASVVVHKTKSFGGADRDPGDRFFFEVRNKAWTFTRSTGLSPFEKLQYGGATLLRWARTVTGSTGRRALVAAGARGLAAGLRHGPRPTDEVLAELSAQASPADGSAQ